MLFPCIVWLSFQAIFQALVCLCLSQDIKGLSETISLWESLKSVQRTRRGRGLGTEDRREKWRASRCVQSPPGLGPVPLCWSTLTCRSSGEQLPEHLEGWPQGTWTPSLSQNPSVDESKLQINSSGFLCPFGHLCLTQGHKDVFLFSYTTLTFPLRFIAHVNFHIGCKVIEILFVSCGYPVSALFIEKLLLKCFNACVRNRLTVSGWVYFWTLLLHWFVLTLVTHCPDYCGFLVKSWKQVWKSSKSAFSIFFLAPLDSMNFHKNLNQLVICCIAVKILVVLDHKHFIFVVIVNNVYELHFWYMGISWFLYTVTLVNSS